MKREETVDYHIKATWHAIARMYNSGAGKFGLSVATGYILLNIDSEQGTPSTKIAPLLGLEARSITRSLKNLEEEGYIYKLQDEKDKRFFRIFLTNKGKQARELSRKGVIRFNEAVQTLISKEQLEQFFAVIQTINQVIEQQGQQLEAEQQEEAYLMLK